MGEHPCFPFCKSTLIHIICVMNVDLKTCLQNVSPNSVIVKILPNSTSVLYAWCVYVCGVCTSDMIKICLKCKGMYCILCTLYFTIIMLLHLFVVCLMPCKLMQAEQLLIYNTEINDLPIIISVNLIIIPCVHLRKMEADTPPLEGLPQTRSTTSLFNSDMTTFTAGKSTGTPSTVQQPRGDNWGLLRPIC